VWRLADGTPLVPPLVLSQGIGIVAVHRGVIVSTAGADIAVHQLAIRALPPSRCISRDHGDCPVS
jgi:hypothetical protein